MNSQNSELKPSDSDIYGWLLLPSIGTILYPFLFFLHIISYLLFLDLTLPLSIFYTSYTIGLFLLSILLFFRFYNKRKSAPKTYIVFLLCVAVFNLIDIILLERVWWDAIGIIFCLIWILYFLKSKRVKRTFVN